MTPLQVISLTIKVREAQKNAHKQGKGFMDRYSVMMELEDQLDAALEPYINYIKAEELQDGK